MNTPTTADVLKAAIAAHRAEIARLLVVVEERRLAHIFAIHCYWDARDDLRETKEALADAIEALADLRRSERQTKRSA